MEVKKHEISFYEIDLEVLTSIQTKITSLESKINSLNFANKISSIELLSRQEVAKFFKVNISTIRNWSKQGILKKYGVGDRVYYKRDEVEAALVEIQETHK